MMQITCKLNVEFYLNLIFVLVLVFSFVSLLFVSLFVSEFATVKLRFIGLVTKGHRSIGLEEGAKRARRRRNRWRQAMTSLSCDAMPSTDGSAQPSTTLEVSSSHPRVSPFGVLPFPAYHSFPSTAGLRTTRLRAPLVSLGCGHRRATERSGLYQTRPLNLPLGAPRRP